MNKFFKFLQDNSMGGMWGAMAGLILSWKGISGMTFALQRLFPNIPPEKVAVGENTAYYIIAGFMAGIVISAFSKLTKRKSK